MKASILYATRELPPGAAPGEREKVRDTLLVLTSDPDAPFYNEAWFSRRDFSRRSGLGTLCRLDGAQMARLRDALAREGFFALKEGGDPADRAPEGPGRNRVTYVGPDGSRTVSKKLLDGDPEALVRFTRVEKLLIAASQEAPVIPAR